MELMYPFTISATLFAVLIYMWMGFKVGQARGAYNVDAPSTDGPPEFRRAYRAHINTLEGMASFLPGLWIFAFLVSDMWAAAVGLVWCVGRLVYAIGYHRDAEKRFPGLGVSFIATLTLILGSVVAVVWPHI
ncbi:MAG: MAPEG family protein [Alphaproteobacteria bacterium]|nr:MAPEG family protein [Alphaproteobacteria bacterium]